MARRSGEFQIRTRPRRTSRRQKAAPRHRPLRTECGTFGARQGDHRGGEIEPHRQGPALGGRCHDETWSAGEIQHAQPGADPSGVEQVVDKPLGRVSEGGGVVLRRALPSHVLEGSDSFRVESHPNAVAARATRSARSRWRGSARASTPVRTAGSAVSGEPEPKPRVARGHIRYRAGSPPPSPFRRSRRPPSAPHQYRQ